MKKLLNYLLIGLILIQIIYVAYGVVVNPLPTGDAYGIWFLKAKAMTQSTSIGSFTNFLENKDYLYSHPEYPLLWPFILSLFGERLITWMVIYPVLFVLIIFVTYTMVKNKTNHLSGLVAAFAISSTMILERLSGRNEVGFADLPLALFYLLGVWVFYQDKVNWAWLGLFLGVAANIKIEGLMGAILLAFILRPKSRVFWLIFLPLASWWPVTSHILNFNNIYKSNLNLGFLVNHLDRIPTILPLAFQEITKVDTYGLWLVIFLLGIFINNDSKILKINMWVISYLACLAASYIFTPLPIVSHWQTSFYRIISGMLPIIIASSSIMVLWNLERKLK
jgi:hypothetical protein